MDVGAPQRAPEKSRKHELTVVAALILRDSKILVCQRRRDDSHALQWEFPGGKVETGETPRGRSRNRAAQRGEFLADRPGI